MNIIPRGDNGYFQPSSEEELQALIKYAHDNGVPLRVRGSAHSVTQSIYTNGYDGTGIPPGDAIDVMLNRYRKITITPDPKDPSHATVEVEAGCNLGFNPYDPTHTSTWENSLNNHLLAAGYALEDTGGITHQTISGFMSTGSSGGSLTYSFDRNLIRFTFIDGTGKLWDVSRDDPDPVKRDMFFAAGVSMGLLGVISRVWLRVGPTFNIYGTQTTTETSKAGIDLFGKGTGDPSLVEFFRNTPYTRLMWWPQHGLDRMSVWQAARMAPRPGFKPQPYEEMGRAPRIEALAGSLFYTFIGNLGDVSVVPDKLVNWYKHLEGTLADSPNINACPPVRLANQRQGKIEVGDVVAKLVEPMAKGIEKLIAEKPEAARRLAELAPQGLAAAPQEKMGLPLWLAKLITDGIKAFLEKTLSTPEAQKIADVLNEYMPWLITYVLEVFITEGTQYFWETWRCGLPMDNQMDDQLWDTVFTELWIPVEKSAEVMSALATFYAAGGDAEKAYPRTGSFSCEIYAATESPFWMSPSYGGPMIRIDVFWFGLNAGSPDEVFYPQFWELLAPFGYRPHWGKHLGPAQNYLGNLPKRNDFLSLRARLDPKGIFLTDYWTAALGIETSKTGKAV
ncbi:MAG: FAD-binding protein [Minicystis sp.]